MTFHSNVMLCNAMSLYSNNSRYCYVIPCFCILITAGPKLVSLNEKQRGFPTGLCVMESDKYQDTLLYVDSSLEKAKFLNSDLMAIQRMDVWGCGGAEAAESQRRVKEWEKKEILRRRLVGYFLCAYV